jgi:CelD/BcsL family acetyltransferase involved in cellulose biosynthesis
MHLRARLFTSLEDLAPHADRWNELVQFSPGNSIFLTWEWLSAWNRHVAKDIPLFIIAVFDEQEHPQAFLPLYQSSFRLFKCISYKCLRPMGDCHCGAEYPDIISSPDAMEDALQCIDKCLEPHRDKWDCLYLPYVSGWTSAASRMARLNTHNRAFFRQRVAVFSSIPLPESIEEYNHNMLGSLYPLIRRQKKKLKQTGRISISLCQQEQDLPLYLDSLFHLHKKRWESIGQQGSFVRRPLMQDFYAGFAATALQKGWLKLFSLQIDGVTLAVQIGYLYHGVFYHLQEGFDPDGPGGIGNVLRHAVIDWCITNKVQEYDYLGGDEDHKLKWGATRRTGYHLFCGARSPKNFLLALADIWPSGRFITEGPPTSYGCSHD